MAESTAPLEHPVGTPVALVVLPRYSVESSTRPSSDSQSFKKAPRSTFFASSRLPRRIHSTPGAMPPLRGTGTIDRSTWPAATGSVSIAVGYPGSAAVANGQSPSWVQLVQALDRELAVVAQWERGGPATRSARWLRRYVPGPPEPGPASTRPARRKGSRACGTAIRRVPEAQVGWATTRGRWSRSASTLLPGVRCGR